MPSVFVRLREGGEEGGVGIPADGRVRLTPVRVVDPTAWVTSAPTVLDVVGGAAEPVGVSPGRWEVKAFAAGWAHEWTLDLTDSDEPVNLATLTPIDPSTPLPWLPTEADLDFIRETRDRIPELIEEAVAEGDYTGPAGRGIASVSDPDSEGRSTVTYTDGTMSVLRLPVGEDGLSAYEVAQRHGFEGSLSEWLVSLRGADGPAPDVEWDGAHLVVGDQRSPDLTGPASTVPGPAPDVSWDGPVLVVGGERSPDLTGKPGTPGPPGAVPTVGSYTLVGPGRPDQPATTGGLVTAQTPVGASYTSTDGAGVGAWAWLKTGPGWIVTAGDTGWRDIRSLSEGMSGQSVSGTLQIKMTASLVSLSVNASFSGDSKPSYGYAIFLPSASWRTAENWTYMNFGTLNSDAKKGRADLRSDGGAYRWTFPELTAGLLVRDIKTYPPVGTWPLEPAGTPASN